MNDVIKEALVMSYGHLEYLDMSSINKYPFFFFMYKGLRNAWEHSCFLMIYCPIPSLMKNMIVIPILFLKLFERISTMLN
jgi:hypothetical protein